MQTSEFAYELPKELISQRPVEPRDASRLMVVHRATGQIEHRRFVELGDFLQAGDILVANDSRVYPARLFGEKVDTGGKVEILLLERLDAQRWRALVGGRRVQNGVVAALYEVDGAVSELRATVSAELGGAERELTFNQPLDAWLDRLGHVPLPPYIHESLQDAARYQTIYARQPGSAAAPTAGLHFTADLLLSLRENGVLFETCTLHVGLDTFQPVSADVVAEHHIHSEWATLTPEAARRINEANLATGRIIAVGTTSARVLETAALRSAGIAGSLQTISASDGAGETTNICPWKPVAAFTGRTDLFIYPGYRFRAMQGLITNFHLPYSSLLMLVSAFAGRELIFEAYREAIALNYRFYSFGDAMLIL